MAEIIAVQGYAGSGKSTHSEYLQRHYMYKGAPIGHISAGDRLRAIRTGVEESQYTHLITDPHASPFSNRLITDVMSEGIDQMTDAELILMNGYPRKVSCVEPFLAAMSQRGHKLIGILGFQITQEMSRARVLARGAREGEVLKESSLIEEADRRYGIDSVRIGEVLRSLGRIAGVEMIDANANVKEVRNRSIEAIGRLGIVLDRAVVSPALE